MKYEVERKFYVDGFASIEEALRRHESPAWPFTAQVDTCLAHPARDFAATHAALRLRRIGQTPRQRA